MGTKGVELNILQELSFVYNSDRFLVALRHGVNWEED